ncbi:NAD-dependent epimerase/dehydratase [Actinobacteria bacterium OK006]|nr:NAD-dependent epimerase/dehydratase [Actinobacteria bacterium OK006]
MTGPRIVLTGATGFIGSAALRALAHDHERQLPGRRTTHVRAVARHPDPGLAALADDVVQADLTDPAGLHGLCDGADVLLHLAGTTSPDPDLCEQVNDRGTQALMAEARRAGVRRIVHLSTAAVYGPGPHHGARVADLRPAPVSPASRTRLAAEAHALAADALVLRPGIVLGPGDRWVVPALTRLVAAVPALWDGGHGRHSLITSDELARLIGHLGHLPGPSTATVLHASHPKPVTTRHLLGSLARHRLLLPVEHVLPWHQCLRALAASGISVSERQFSLLALDHWYDSDEVWRLAACTPDPNPLKALPRAVPWYRAHLQVSEHRSH